MMKRIAFLAIFAGFAAFGFDMTGIVSQLSAKPDGDGITIGWQSDIETGVRSYAVERSSMSSQNNFQEVGNIQSKGSYQNYSWHDSHPQQAISQGGNPSPKPLSDAFQYRLRLNLSDGEVSYSSTVSVTKPSSGVRRTWGMIKEMFH
jgi:hypothetical protein